MINQSTRLGPPAGQRDHLKTHRQITKQLAVQTTWQAKPNGRNRLITDGLTLKKTRFQRAKTELVPPA